MTTESAAETDVVIVGAGPVGLTLACALAHHGVAFRILERKDGPSGDSKGHDLVSRVQELLQAVGAREGIAAKSYPTYDMHFLLDGKPLAQVDLRGGDTPYPAILFNSQAVIESELTALLAARGVAVERGCEVRAIRPDETGVTVEVAGSAEPLRCRYLVGADGVQGTVRKAVGLDFEAEPMPDRATRQIDATLRWQRSTGFDRAWFFLYPKGFGGVMPVWEGVYRLFLIEEEALVPDREPTLDEMVARAREVLGDETFTMTDPVWASHGRFRHGVAPAYRAGRVFLAGDAGHTTLPIGGQGMNAGLRDAVELAWRLAMTLAGAAAPAVLDSYGPERHGAHATLGREQVRGFRQLLYRGRLADAAVSAVADLVPDLGSKVLGGMDLTQLGTAYPDSPLSDDHGPGGLPVIGRAVPAGARAPDARLVRPDGGDTRLFDWIYNPDGRSWGWRLLAFDGRRPGSHPDLAVRAAPGPGATLGALPVLLDRDGDAHRAYGLEDDPALVLVRPDGHIAFRGRPDRPERLAAYCERIAHHG
jgi:3-(3-hydroxy-phenyl)propionate hydroxylase